MSSRYEGIRRGHRTVQVTKYVTRKKEGDNSVTFVMQCNNCFHRNKNLMEATFSKLDIPSSWRC